MHTCNIEIYIHVYIYICRHIYMYVYVYIHTYLCLYTYLCTYTYIYTHMYVYIHIYIYIYVYIYIYIVHVCVFIQEKFVQKCTCRGRRLCVSFHHDHRRGIRRRVHPFCAIRPYQCLCHPLCHFHLCCENFLGLFLCHRFGALPWRYRRLRLEGSQCRQTPTALGCVLGCPLRQQIDLCGRHRRLDRGRRFGSSVCCHAVVTWQMLWTC